jgi:DNA-directed RNA polymerase I subunit RPA1
MRTGQPVQGVAIDNFMRTVLAPLSSEILKTCLPDGLGRPFPDNAFSLMVSTGAKGSTVNQSQISCGLGQQELEGRRVPIMPSGKTLPSFRPYDPDPRAGTSVSQAPTIEVHTASLICVGLAGGFIVDRFLTGIRPQEYYFHCMAGREGLIDTAVKTSRSGYLQRCLVKSLEELSVHYDYTVRDSDAAVVQFLYGEDGIDTMQTKYLDGRPETLGALALNYGALVHKHGVHSKLKQTGLETDTARAAFHRLWTAREQAAEGGELQVGSIVEARRLKRGRSEWARAAWKGGWYPAEVIKMRPAKEGRRGVTYDLRYGDGDEAKKVPAKVTLPRIADMAEGLQLEVIRRRLPDPVMGLARLDIHLGAVSERFRDAVEDYTTRNPHKIIRGEGSRVGSGVKKAGFEFLLWLKYMRCMASPGEAVGSIAGQSIGEPSTQMTLNTFHLAGHGGANVTLGIPRLREILMTASHNIKTPSMTVSAAAGVERAEVERFAHRLRRLMLSDLINHRGGVTVTERLEKTGSMVWERVYMIRLQFYSEEQISAVFSLSYDELLEIVAARYLRGLLMCVSAELKKAGGKKSDFVAVGRARPRDEEGPGASDDADDDEAPDVSGVQMRSLLTFL